MLITLASFKGGQSKTTSAVHLAAYLAQRGRTLLVDGDPNRSALGWTSRGKFPFDVKDTDGAKGRISDYEHTVIDTEARPSTEDLLALEAGCDLLVIPATPDALSLDALMLTLGMLKGDNHRVLLTIIPPAPSKAGEETRVALTRAGWPVLKTGIRRLAAFQKAAMLGRLVQDVSDPRAAQGWADYVAVGKEISQWAKRRRA